MPSDSFFALIFGIDKIAPLNSHMLYDPLPFGAKKLIHVACHWPKIGAQ